MRRLITLDDGGSDGRSGDSTAAEGSAGNDGGNEGTDTAPDTITSPGTLVTLASTQGPLAVTVDSTNVYWTVSEFLTAP